MENRLDPDQARHFVGPDPGPICLQRLSADDTSRLEVFKLLRARFTWTKSIIKFVALLRSKEYT